LRIFGGERIASLMERLGVKEGEPITHDLLTRAIRRAQKRVEERNFEIRKRLLEYDEVMAKQREAIYALRERFLLPGDGKPPDVEELMGYLSEMIGEYAELLTERYAPPSSGPEAWDLEGLAKALARLSEPAPSREELSQAKRWEGLVELVRETLQAQLHRQRERLSPHFPIVARLVLLRVVDENWRQHLLELDDLKEVIGWRAYGGRDPLVEFKREAHRLFQEMLLRAEEEALTFLLSPKLSVRGAPAPPEAVPVGVTPSTASATTPTNPSPVTRHPSRQKKVGRNDPCPCGSGKKYKHCCGKDK
ncbi:SEC-C domain-containing protein, partial [Candidatus Bipolaricaulota bacterium]|nr:SEC-C domain-containing protein [Candidatus Bipolaricaulota bacterium]